MTIRNPNKANINRTGEGMIPGPYTVVRVTFPDEGSDAPTLETIRYGYDTASQAFSDIAKLAEEVGDSPEDLCVIRAIERDEAGDFQS